MAKERLYVIKIGGNIIDAEESLLRFLDAFAGLEEKKILVHGGGKLATRMAAGLQIPQQMVEGRRITDAETLKIVTMVYAGYINKNIVAQLQARHCNAIGLCGADAALVLSHRRTKGMVDYGYVGDVDAVNRTFILSLMQQDITLVAAPITHDGEGQLLNTNADTIAQEIAKAMAADFEVHLIYSFEKNGVLLDVEDENSVITRLTPALYLQYRNEEKIFAGMIPKLDNAFSAIGAGVHRVIIGKAEELEKLAAGECGTSLTHA